jgi:hypothetical protein
MKSWLIRMVLAAVLVWLVSLAAGCGYTHGYRYTMAGKIYDTSYGKTYCTLFQVDNCGVHLGGCNDGYTYDCLLNVREHTEE